MNTENIKTTSDALNELYSLRLEIEHKMLQAKTYLKRAEIARLHENRVDEKALNANAKENLEELQVLVEHAKFVNSLAPKYTKNKSDRMLSKSSVTQLSACFRRGIEAGKILEKKGGRHE